jgi:hypothetical protein
MDKAGDGPVQRRRVEARHDPVAEGGRHQLVPLIEKAPRVVTGRPPTPPRTCLTAGYGSFGFDAAYGGAAAVLYA